MSTSRGALEDYVEDSAKSVGYRDGGKVEGGIELARENSWDIASPTGRGDLARPVKAPVQGERARGRRRPGDRRGGYTRR